MTPPTISCAIVPSPEHNLETHPENHARFQHFHQFFEEPQGFELHEVDPIEVSDETLQRAHSAEYLHALEQAVRQGPGFVDYGDTYVTQKSFEAARNAAGGVLSVMQTIDTGLTQSGFALIRPPGHHATSTKAMGFCLLNNVAIATGYAKELGYGRVMIFDFDVHHGNGTQEIYQDDPDVLYVSTHQAGIFPGTGHLHETGIGAGEGSILNLPLPANTGDLGMKSFLEDILIPTADRFAPDMIFASAGFDAHWEDPLANLQFTIAGYHQIAHVLKRIASGHSNGKIIFVLEGGYNPTTLFEGIRAVLLALSDGDPPLLAGDVAPLQEPGIESLIERVRQIHMINVE